MMKAAGWSGSMMPVKRKNLRKEGVNRGWSLDKRVRRVSEMEHKMIKLVAYVKG
jgi:hypothetical protein